MAITEIDGMVFGGFGIEPIERFTKDEVTAEDLTVGEPSRSVEKMGSSLIVLANTDNNPLGDTARLL